MKKNRFLILCALLLAGTLSITACGMNKNDMNGNKGTEAPYEDETNNKVNGTNNGMNNDANNGTVGGDLKDAGRNLMDSIKDTGDAVRDGINNLGDNNRNNNRTNP